MTSLTRLTSLAVSGQRLLWCTERIILRRLKNNLLILRFMRFQTTMNPFLPPFMQLYKELKRSDLRKETIQYFTVKDHKFARFYLLPKMYKRLYNVPNGPVISNSSYYTENLSSFLDYHLQPLP